MSEADAATSVNVAEKLGFKNGDLIQEFGYDDDVDFDLRDDIEDLTGSELLEEDDHDVVDAVIFWWRDGDGDLVDSLMDSLTTLSENGVVWVLTPKSGRDGSTPRPCASRLPRADLVPVESVNRSGNLSLIPKVVNTATGLVVIPKQ